jgi:hypothetical protein
VGTLPKFHYKLEEAGLGWKMMGGYMGRSMDDGRGSCKFRAAGCVMADLVGVSDLGSS